MKSKLLTLIGIVLAAAIGLTIGLHIGYNLEAYRLRQCEAQNKQLSNDLRTAVSRGIAIESDLIQCKEHKK